MGAWIETCDITAEWRLEIVAPRVGAWIETSCKVSCVPVLLSRPVWVGVSYRDETGDMKKLKATNGLSELLQHEIDHINGIVAVDRAISTKHIILRSEM